MITKFLNIDGSFKMINLIELEPAPPSRNDSISDLEELLINIDLPIAIRYTALVKLKKIATLESAKAIFRGCAKIATFNIDDSDLLTHDCIYTLGQFQIKESIDLLVYLLENGKHSVARHEAAFALGNMWINDVSDERIKEIISILNKTLVKDNEIIVRESCQVAISNLMFNRQNISVLPSIDDVRNSMVKVDIV